MCVPLLIFTVHDAMPQLTMFLLTVNTAALQVRRRTSSCCWDGEPAAALAASPITPVCCGGNPSCPVVPGARAQGGRV
jgi:hypothetical protein